VNTVSSILHFAKTRREFPALIEGTRTLTYGELADLVRRTATHLSTCKLQRGDRVGLCLKDNSEQIVVLLTAAYLGVVVVPLDWRARPTENEAFVKELGVKCVISHPDLALTGTCSVLLLDEEWHRSVAQADLRAETPTEWHDPFVISATSGSTGLPKFTLMTYQQYHFAMCGMLEVMDLAGRHRFLCNLPLYYSGGRNSCLAHLLRGDSVVLYPSLFSPREYIDVVNRQHISVGVMVPAMVRQLLNADDHGPLLPGLTKLFCTGAPLHGEEKRCALRKLTPNFHERYGTAETLAISMLRPEDFANRADSVGQPHSLVRVDVADENDRPLPVGSAGNLRLSGPGLASPLGQASQKSFRNGWYYPGEIAVLDDAGYIFLQGRTSDVIIRSGAKIYPAEVESVLAKHPNVIEVAVIGQAGATKEEEVIAFVVTRGAPLSGELLAHCRSQLTPHKVPQQIHFVAELPKNTAGKIDKIALAKRLNAGGVL
jgi:acyl-coenzyme A synthetase/AMP-(fatty) acid ligase